MLKNLLTLLALGISPLLMAIDTKIVSIEPQYRSAEELAIVIKPLLSDVGSLQTDRNLLIIKDSPSNITAIQKLLNKIDIAAPQFTITVSHGKDKPESNNLTQLNNKNMTGLKTQRTLRTTRERNRKIHQLIMHSGETAFVESGISIPIVNHEGLLSDQGLYNAQYHELKQNQKDRINAELPANNNTSILSPAQGNPLAPLNPLPLEENEEPNRILSIPPQENALITTDADPLSTVSVDVSHEQENRTQTFQEQAQRDLKANQRDYSQQLLKSGIYLKPQLVGSDVRLQITTVTETPHRNSGQRAAQETPAYSFNTSESTVVVPMGEWVLIGGNQVSDSNSSEIRTKDRAGDSFQIWVKVEGSEL